jgi:hypothetical protein
MTTNVYPAWPIVNVALLHVQRALARSGLAALSTIAWTTMAGNLHSAIAVGRPSAASPAQHR